MPVIIEIKAKCAYPENIRFILENQKADFKGVDHQIDTYFKVNYGRLKLREGTIENNLIHYVRSNQAEPKQSDVLLYKSNPDSTLKSILTAANGILTVVDKQRAIYFIDNVKFHIDQVQQLGSFVEIEAIDTDGSISLEELNIQCQYYLNLFEIEQQNLVEVSYSDLLIAKKKRENTISQTNKNGSYVYFALKGEVFDPQMITNRLEILPTSAWKKGDKGKYNPSLKFSCWQLSTKEGKEYFDIDSLISEIIEQLKDKVPIINELKSEYKLNSVLEIVMHIDTNLEKSTPFLGHDLETLKFLHQTGTITDVDIYRFNSKLENNH